MTNDESYEDEDEGLGGDQDDDRDDGLYGDEDDGLYGDEDDGLYGDEDGDDWEAEREEKELVQEEPAWLDEEV